MPSKHADYVRYIAEDLLAGLPHITVKRMFGGHGFYFEGRMFGLEADGRIYFKVDEQSQPDYELAGSEPFRYSSKDRTSVTMSYWTLPDDVLEDHEKAVMWAEKAIQAARRSSMKKKKPRHT
ncbi:TfoX/Sxy family protein [Candidatus Uhrbacteria bacterium]|nr:TfoX/Sxy family protein [Candidatus Uhrbacteria bacterium]